MAGWTYEAAVRVTANDFYGESGEFDTVGDFQAWWVPAVGHFPGPISFVGQGGVVTLGSGVVSRSRPRIRISAEKLLEAPSERGIEALKTLMERVSDEARGTALSPEDSFVRWTNQLVTIQVTAGEVIYYDGAAAHTVTMADVDEGGSGPFAWTFDPKNYAPAGTLVLKATFRVICSSTVKTHTEPPTDTADTVVNVTASTIMFN